MTGRTVVAAGDPGDELERRREPFVPDRRRVVYPVDHATSQRAALAKFQAEVRLVVGAQLTNRIVDEACDLEDRIRSRVHDDTEYAELEVLRSSYMAAAVQVRDAYMGVDNQWRGR